MDLPGEYHLHVLAEFQDEEVHSGEVLEVPSTLWGDHLLELGEDGFYVVLEDLLLEGPLFLLREPPEGGADQFFEQVLYIPVVHVHDGLVFDVLSEDFLPAVLLGDVDHAGHQIEDGLVPIFQKGEVVGQVGDLFLLTEE